MSEITDKQLKIRWSDIKKQIKERPLLAYRVSIPLDEWDKYMHSNPSADEINRIYYAIQEDRKNKTLRIKEGLSEIVGYRESKQFSRKAGVSDTSIREILEGKKDMAGYDVINRLEIFLHVIMPDFELSIENPLNVKSFTAEAISEIASKINHVADNLKSHCFKLTELAKKQEKEKDWAGKNIDASYFLKFDIESLTELKNQIDLIWETYIDKKRNK